MANKKKMETYTPERFNEAELVGTFESGTSEWHEARAEGIGGSDVGAILGLNKYESAFSLWSKKANILEAEPVDNWSVRFGKAFEMPLLELFAEQYPELDIYTTGTYRHSTYKYMTANPDALAYDKQSDSWIIVEIKTSRMSMSEWPESYKAQVNHYMDVLGVERAVIVGISGWDYVEEWIDADAFVLAAQRDAVTKFWERVTTGEAPDWDGADATYETIRKMHPAISDEEVEVSGGHELVLAKQDLERAKTKFNSARNEVMGLMADARYAYVEADGVKHYVAERRARGQGEPFLVVKNEGERK